MEGEKMVICIDCNESILLDDSYVCSVCGEYLCYKCFDWHNCEDKEEE